MTKIITYIAMSADGYIARPDGNVDWLNRPRQKHLDDGRCEHYRIVSGCRRDRQVQYPSDLDLIGEGIPLVSPRHRDVKLTLLESKPNPDGVVNLHYQIG